MSALEETLMQQFRAAGLVEPFREYAFALPLGRGWRADFCFFDQHLLVEVEGGIYTSGRHTRASGFEEDCRKYAAALMLGWRVLRVTSAMIADGTACALVQAVLLPRSLDEMRTALAALFAPPKQEVAHVRRIRRAARAGPRSPIVPRRRRRAAA